MARRHLSNKMVLTSDDNVSQAPPPPYTVSPHTPDPQLLALALRDFRMSQDPAQWGTRKTATNEGPSDRQLTGIAGWIIWLADCVSSPAPSSWSNEGVPHFVAFGHMGAL
jgi:hypothetical protein